MTKSFEARGDALIESSIPVGAVPLESILCTDELHRRPSRPPGHEEENRALVKLVSALADSPSTILQTVAETILHITQCDSAGLSLLTRDGQTPDACGERFYWAAIAGMWNPHVGGGTPRNFGPCGDVLDQNRTLLFKHFERRYPYLLPVFPAAEECLLVPFYVAGKTVGTIWAIMHSDRRKFDAEDDRVMGSLGKFASSAYQALTSISDRLRLGEVQASRARIAKAADDARRTIERDLHDGAQQQFVAVAMRLESARRLIEDAPADAARLVDAAHADLREAIAELQRLAHGIHPAELPKRGLTAALRTLARRSATPVEVKAADVGRLQPEIEATAYYIAAEATANAVKHASAGHVEIALARTSGALQLTVTDDGVGGAAFGGGTGLQGLRDRADAAGGHLTLVSPAGGPTVLTADLPIPGPPAARR